MMGDGRWTITVARTQEPLAHHARMARSMLQRVVGLLGRGGLEAGEALMFPRCRCIHTWGMRFSIDVIFVDRAWRVVSLSPCLGPWRMTSPAWKAWGAIETAAGTIERAGLRVGDALHVVQG